MINPLIYFLLFLKASLFSTGGFSNLPSLHQDLLANGWAKESYFGQSIAIGQISPGPNGLWVISLGYLTYGYQQPFPIYSRLAQNSPDDREQKTNDSK